MLIKFSVKNFKSFDHIEFDLFSNEKSNLTLIYGKTGVGKTNLHNAFFDILNNIGVSRNKEVKNKTLNKNSSIQNFNSINKETEFSYIFKLDKSVIEYIYIKDINKNIIAEKIIKNRIVVLEENYLNIYCNGKSKVFENLSIENNEKEELLEIKNYISQMLDNNVSIPLHLKQQCNKNNFITLVKDIQLYINEFKFSHPIIIENDEFYFKINENKIPFSSIASKTENKLLDWLLFIFTIKNNPSLNKSLIFIDDFDYSLTNEFTTSRVIINELKKLNNKIILITNNLELMNQDSLPIDSYYLLQKNSHGETTIKNLSKLTEKEIKLAHNVKKLYKAGIFDLN